MLGSRFNSHPAVHLRLKFKECVGTTLVQATSIQEGSITMLREQDFTRDHEKCLRDQVVTDSEPGPVLHDFQMLLDFVGPQGVEAGGKYNLLPLKFISELDSRLSRPLNLALKRPLLRSHPYLQGLHLLLRASGLTIVEGIGPKARLVVSPEMLVQWKSLNPTEQYFTLLEAWLRFGRDEMVGERESGFQRPLLRCLNIWRDLPGEGLQFDGKKPGEVYIIGTGGNLFHVALMDLFGCLTVRHPQKTAGPWNPAGVAHTSFGDAALSLISSRVNYFSDELSLMNDDEGPEGDPTDQSLPTPRFGAWQPLFQPFFPAWLENLELPAIEPRDGTFIFRVSLGKIWRLIAMPADATLYDLVDCILGSVNFDDDHLHQFTFRDRMGATQAIAHPAMEEGPWTDEFVIGTLPLEAGQSMELLYDFGDNWPFTVKLERVEPPSTKAKGPRILEKHGKSPVQYASWDDE
jgi:hypothetical protein